MPFCPSCGKQGVKGLCEDCRANELIIAIKEKKITFCYQTNKTFIRNKWLDTEGLEDGIAKTLKDSIKTKKGVTLEFESDVSQVPLKPGVKRKVKTIVYATLGSTTEDYEFLLDVEITHSPNVAKAGTEYLEAILQLRGVRDDSAIEWVRNELKKMKPKGMHITKEKKHKDGMDFVVTKKKLLRGFAEKIVGEFGGVSEPHLQVFSMDKNTMKDIIRLNLKVTLSPYLKGDVIKVDDKLVIVTTTKKNDVSCVELDTCKRISFSLKRKKPEIIAEKKTYHETSITRISPHIEVMDPESYESTAIRNEKYMKENLAEQKQVVGKKVKVIIHNGVWFVK